MDTPHGDERVIGVAKDFAFDPLFKAVQPFVFDMTTDIGQWLRNLHPLRRRRSNTSDRSGAQGVERPHHAIPLRVPIPG